MKFYTEALVWYLLALDCLFYLILSWSKGGWHKRTTHWLSDYLPLEKGFSLVYLALTLWVGYTLWRMQLIFH